MPASLFNYTSVAPCGASIDATGTLTQGRCVTYGGATAGAGAVVAGIAEFDAVSGDRVTITVGAIQVPVIAGNAVAVGAAVASDSAGRLVTAAAGNYVVGRALTAAGAANDVFLIRLTHEGTLP